MKNDSPCQTELGLFHVAAQEAGEKKAQLDMLGYPWKAKDRGGVECIPGGITWLEPPWLAKGWRERGPGKAHVRSVTTEERLSITD